MNQLNSINNIASLLSRFVVQVKGLNSINQYGINVISETILIPVFNEVYGYNLSNLNKEYSNYPGLDLGDKKVRISFQITSKADSEKIKDTLELFLANKYYESYDKLIIYCITEKSKIKNNFSENTNGKFHFDATKDVIDYTDLLKEINSLTDYGKVQRIENLLTKQFSEIKLQEYHVFESQKYESVYSNLLKISFPKELNTARIAISRKDIKKKRGIYNDRQLIFQYKKEADIKFSSDWIDLNKQLYTFHDLSNTNHEISKVIDLGTRETILCEDFYSTSKDHERAFKALLKFCFSKYAHFLGIDFNHDEDLYIFACEDEDRVVRSETWMTGKRRATRDVIKVKIHKKSNTVWYYTHLAFSIAFKYYQNEWFLEISPDWFITRDGFKKHYSMNKEVASWLKRKERNLHVFNNTKFIANYLKYGKLQTDLFKEKILMPRNFINLIRFESFGNSPLLNEIDWKLTESKEVLESMIDQDGDLESEL